MSGFKVEFSVLNLQATPGIYASSLATRPAAGQPGRVFIDTDNPSSGMYRDTGTAWVQIAGTGGGGGGTLQTVTDAGNTTTNSISVGHAAVPVSPIDARQSTNNLSNQSNWAITANNNPIIAASATFGTNYVNAIYGAQTQLFRENATIGNSGLNTAGLFINTLNGDAPGVPGVITVNQASTVRAISGTQTGIYYGGSHVGVTYSHVAAFKTFQPINTGSAATVTNNYGIIVADSTPSSGSITYTNRWGVYQEGANDLNYFASKILIGTTTDAGNFKLQILGNSYTSSQLFVATTTAPPIVLGFVQANLIVGGADALINGITVGRGFGLASNQFSTALGVDANYYGGGIKTSVGYYANKNGGNRNTAVGYLCLQNAGGDNTAIGHEAGSSVSSGTENTFIGGFAGGTGVNISNSVIVGFSAGYFTTGNDNTFIGYRSGQGITSGIRNTFVGFNSGYNGITTGNYNTIIGAEVTGLSSSLSNNIILADGQGNRRLNIDSSGNVGINTSSPAYRFDVSGDIRATTSAYFATSSGAVGINTTSVNAAALLQIDSTTKGFLTSRATTAEIKAVTTPPAGLFMYSTDDAVLAFYDGTGWRKVNHSAL